MRIIAGKARGRKIAVPPVPGVRPTLDRVREALFSVVHGMLRGEDVLDLFAGSGSLGIEALSRGARHAMFVDSQRTCLEVIENNLRRCDFEDSATVLCGVVPHCFSDVQKKHDGTYGIVFIDPPYQTPFDVNILIGLHRFSLLKEGAIIIIEHDRRKDIDCLPGCCLFERKRVYGEVGITMVTYKP